jgi:hypothetical protein
VVGGSGVLVSSDIWYLDDARRFDTFRERTAQTTLAPGIGLAGRVAHTRHPAWLLLAENVSDVIFVYDLQFRGPEALGRKVREVLAAG